MPTSLCQVPRYEGTATMMIEAAFCWLDHLDKGQRMGENGFGDLISLDSFWRFFDIQKLVPEQ